MAQNSVKNTQANVQSIFTIFSELSHCIAKYLLCYKILQSGSSNIDKNQKDTKYTFTYYNKFKKKFSVLLHFIYE